MCSRRPKKGDWKANTRDGMEKEIGNKTKVKSNTKWKF
jgi:hypothetical protein